MWSLWVCRRARSASCRATTAGCPTRPAAAVRRAIARCGTPRITAGAVGPTWAAALRSIQPRARVLHPPPLVHPPPPPQPPPHSRAGCHQRCPPPPRRSPPSLHLSRDRHPRSPHPQAPAPRPIPQRCACEGRGPLLRRTTRRWWSPPGLRVGAGRRWPRSVGSLRRATSLGRPAVRRRRRCWCAGGGRRPRGCTFPDARQGTSRAALHKGPRRARGLATRSPGSIPGGPRSKTAAMTVRALPYHPVSSASVRCAAVRAPVCRTRAAGMRAAACSHRVLGCGLCLFFILAFVSLQLVLTR